MKNLKKFAALAIAATMMFTCAACGGGNGEGNNTQNENNTQVENNTQTENNDTQANNDTQNEGGAVNAEIADAADLLTKVWDEYKTSASEDVQFPIGGGDAENMTMDVPGKYDVTVEGGAEGLTATYCIPADVIAMADNFATGLHMMMSNNFTTAALHVTDAANVETAVAAIKDATINNQWMCGMPEKLVIVTIGEDYVVSAYGLEAIIDAYKTAITTVYGDAAVISVEESLMQ